MLALFTLLACTFFPDEVGWVNESADGALPLVGDCDPNVLIPVGFLDEAPSLPAEPHAERYGPTPLPRHVHLGLPSRDPSRSVSMLWQTDPGTLASIVRIGPASAWPEGAIEVHGASFLYGGVEIGTGELRQHEARLCGALEPDTAYTYQVGGGEAWSEAVTFTTPGAPRSFDTFRVAISGDSRGGYDTWRAIIEAADAHEPDLFIFTGDMVNIGTSQDEWDQWFDAAEAVLARKPLVATHGNHEFLAPHYFAQLGFPGNEEWFAVEYGDMILVNLNDTVRDAEQIGTEQAAFADAEFTASTARWRVAMHHKPEFSQIRGHGSDEALREAWAPIWDKHALDLVLTGHNHAYERSAPIRDGAVAEGGTTYIVSGGSGAPLYSTVEAQWFGAVSAPIEHYVIADFSAEGLDIVARDLAGNVLDTFHAPR